MNLDVWLKKRRSCILLKDAIAKKLCRERTVLQFEYIQGHRRPTERLHLKFPISPRN